MLESLLSTKNLRIHQSPGDGHCLLHSMLSSWSSQHPSDDINYDLNSLKAALYVETYTYSAHYVPYMCTTFLLNEFLPVTSDELKIIVNRSPPTNCDLDPAPTRLLKEQLECIIPLMVDFVNKSLCSGVFPDCVKQAIVVPLLKKKSLDKNVYSNYRPVSNLAFTYGF